MEIQFTRKDYMDRQCTHQEYFVQFVTPATRAAVVAQIGKERLRNVDLTKDPYLNRIPLVMWDRLVLPLPTHMLKEAGENFSLSTKVCIAKAAAVQLLRGGE